MKKPFRHRQLFLFVGTLAVLAASLLTDPDAKLFTIPSWLISTAVGVVAVGQAVWAIAAAHWARKAVLDYPEADLQTLFKQILAGNVAAGLGAIALAIVFVGFLMVFAPRAHAGELPAGFYKYSAMLKTEQQHYWPSHPQPAYLAALVEQESCISLKSRGCWNPAAQLKTNREEGAGMGQITRAFRADGSIRFDALAGLRHQYGNDLSEWSWGNVYTRPDLQMRAIVLMSRDAAMPFRAAPAMLAFGDAGYNGGVAGVQKERRACGLTKGCDAGSWFGNVENHCLKSRQPLYGGRSACDINREHVRNVFKVRWKKYAEAMA